VITTAVKVWPLVASKIITAGQAVDAAMGPALGGYIVNPLLAADQGLTAPEVLYVDPVNPAVVGVTPTCSAIQPGGRFKIPAGFAGRAISVNAASAGHKFAGVVVQGASNFQPLGGFPPAGPTTVLGGLPSYLYQQYNDDEDLQAFVDAYNQLAQAYVAWFANASLPVYAGNPLITGALLDWVASGIYGMKRPVLPSGLSSTRGPFNTAAFNTIPFNALIRQGPTGIYATSDDIFKRILTWHLWRGDGFVFNVRWLKRRVQRFLTGTNGTAGQTDQTYQVSVTFGTDNEININLQTTRRFATKGATFNVSPFNAAPFNDLQTTSLALPVSPYVPIFKAAVQAGVLELPFMWQVIVNTN
jgi:hypothetical protein